MNHLRILLATFLLTATCPFSAKPTDQGREIQGRMQRVNTLAVGPSAGNGVSGNGVKVQILTK